MCMGSTRNDTQSEQGDVLAVTMVEAARRLGVSRTAVYDLVAKGQIRRVYIGTRPRITVAELKRFLEGLAFEEFNSGIHTGEACKPVSTN